MDYFRKKKTGNAESELLVLGFVTEEVHAQESADAAAGDGQPDKGFFRDAQKKKNSIPFVDAVDEEGHNVDADEVNDEVAHSGRLYR